MLQTGNAYFLTEEQREYCARYLDAGGLNKKSDITAILETETWAQMAKEMMSQWEGFDGADIEDVADGLMRAYENWR